MWEAARETAVIVVTFFSVAVSESEANLKLMLRGNQGIEIPDTWGQNN